MVETIMFFALGTLVASLIALLIIPAINARADRLARRRAEALFPLSISELTAQKDHLRAEFAVLQRRLERKAEAALAVKHRNLEELGHRAVRIETLETELAGREGIIADLRAALAETAARLVTTDEELTGEKSALSGMRDTLAAVENAHRKALDELANTRAELHRTAATLASTKTELALLQDRLEAREAKFADLDARHSAVLGELDTKRIAISDLETRLTLQTSRCQDFERNLAERRQELTEERQHLSEMTKTLRSEQERASILQGERDAKAAEAAALAGRLRTLSGNGDMLLSSFEEHMQTIRSLQKDLDASQARIATLEAALEGERALPEDIHAENAELRRLIVEVADDVIHATDSETPAAQERRKVRG